MAPFLFNNTLGFLLSLLLSYFITFFRYSEITQNYTYQCTGVATEKNGFKWWHRFFLDSTE